MAELTAQNGRSDLVSRAITKWEVTPKMKENIVVVFILAYGRDNEEEAQR